MTGTIFNTPLNQTLPPALEGDPRIVALATALAKQLQKQAMLIHDTVGIYYRIDELSETMLDMLATDFHVDWYDYNAAVNIKRNLIKNSIAIHRKAGTLAGLRLLVESIHGDSSIEEWFEYGGKPYFFRIGININDVAEVINNKSIIDAVNAYKPVRAHLEDDAIAYRSANAIRLFMRTNYAIYSTPASGTSPISAVSGMVEESDLLLKTMKTSGVYSTPKTGDLVSGTEPNSTVVGAENTNIVPLTATAEGIAYETPVCGTSNFL
jgi:phage tail P2-like protein